MRQVFEVNEIARRQLEADHERRQRELADIYIRKMEAICDAVGIQRPAEVSIVGIMNDILEKDVRTKLAKAWNCSRLRLQINSPGGSVGVSDRITKDIRELGKFTEAHVQGVCASAALSPLLAASWRTSGATARFLLHSSRFFVEREDFANATRLRQMAALAEEKDRDYLQFLQRQLNLTPKQVEILRRQENLILSAKMAQAVGLVHALR